MLAFCRGCPKLAESNAMVDFEQFTTFGFPERLFQRNIPQSLNNT
jgi:hypothetical protein